MINTTAATRSTTSTTSTATPQPHLPASLEEVVRIIGIDATMKVVQAYGGIRLYIPGQMTALHHLANLLGIEQARKLSKHFGREVIVIPRMAAAKKAERNREIQRRYDAGERVRELARAFGLTDRQIYTVLNQAA